VSFLDDIVNVGSSVWDWATGNSTSAGVARAAALGYMLKEVQASINKDNERGQSTGSSSGGSTTLEQDYGVREQVDPDTTNVIPVVYGQAFLAGSVIDAVLSEDNQTMWYCITICEKTGVLMSTFDEETGTAIESRISFEGMYWNNGQLTFAADGITATALTDADGNSSDDVNGLIQVWLYNNGSNSPTRFTGYSEPALAYPAYEIFPNWTPNHTMDNIVFAIVKVTYNKTKNVTGLGTLEFKMKNTLSQPGDVIYDYLTNKRYGAGIAPEEINQ
jgi:hypothetical protein